LGDRAAIDETASRPAEKNSAEAALDCALVRDGPYSGGGAKDRINSGDRCRVDVRRGTENDLALERVEIEGRGLNGIDRGLRLRIARRTNTERHNHRGHWKRQARRATQQTCTESAAYGAAHTIPRFNVLHAPAPKSSLRGSHKLFFPARCVQPSPVVGDPPGMAPSLVWRGSMLKERCA
jgi:hypothetical protein